MISLTRPLTVAEYFAGIGLVRIGLEECGWSVTFANDISEKKHALYRGFFPNTSDHYIISDIFDLNPEDVPSTMLATCSFPCIDLSLAGNMDGIQGKHSSAFWGFIRILEGQKELAPSLVLVENVTGWLHSNGGSDFRLTVQALNELGYACDVFNLDALSFTPQSRPRVFLIGVRSQPDSTSPTQIFSRPRLLLSERLRKSIFENLDLNWFYIPIPAPPDLRTKGLAKIIEDMDDIDDRWWSDSEVKRHLGMMKDSHHQRVMELANADRIEYRTFYRRIRDRKQRAEVRDDDLAGCLRTASGGSAKQFLIKAGRGHIQMRVMTPREYARLQGVPDCYPIAADGVQALTGFGDAVCVPAIAWIAQNVLNPLAEKLLSPEGYSQ
jgi:DNA (cytosine-5)-methyltransferase 1